VGLGSDVSIANRRGQGVAHRLINEDAARILPVFSGTAVLGDNCLTSQRPALLISLLNPSST
jgi:hypothetical protein